MLARLQPIPQDKLIEAHRTLKEFPTRWKEADAEGRQRLLNLILQRAWVCDDHLCAIMLRPSYYVSVHQAIKDGMIKDLPPEQLPPFLQKENGNLRIMASCRCGSDGDDAQTNYNWHHKLSRHCVFFLNPEDVRTRPLVVLCAPAHGSLSEIILPQIFVPCKSRTSLGAQMCWIVKPPKNELGCSEEGKALPIPCA